MNHQPFEELLLADEPPAGEQALELRRHLRDCPRCRQLEVSWTEVHNLFQETEQITPAPGFTTSWQTRLQVQQARNRRFYSKPWLWFVLNFSIATVLLILLGLQIWRAFNTTAQLLLVKAFFLSIILTFADVVHDFLTITAQVTERFPAVQWAFLLGMSGFLGMFWITVGRQIVSTRRITL